MGEFTRRRVPVRPKQPDRGESAPGTVQMMTPASPLWLAPPALRLTGAGLAGQSGFSRLSRPTAPPIQRLAVGDALPDLDALVKDRLTAENRPVEVADEVPAGRRIVNSPAAWGAFAVHVGHQLTQDQITQLHPIIRDKLAAADDAGGLKVVKEALNSVKKFTGDQVQLLDRLKAKAAGRSVGLVVDTEWEDVVGDDLQGGAEDVETWLRSNYNLYREIPDAEWAPMKRKFRMEPAIPLSIADDFREFVRTQGARLSAMKMDKVKIVAPPSTSTMKGRRDQQQLVRRLQGLDLMKIVMGHPELAGPQANPQWKDNAAPAVAMQPAKSDMAEDALSEQTVKGKADAADKKIRQMVAPDVLSTIPPPPVYAYPHKENVFRAFCDSTAVHVAHHDRVEIFVHEMGHWIEDRLPPEKWFNIQAMLRKRHDWAGGTTAVGGLSGSDSALGRFGGSYGTGNYTSKIYTSGATEVVSMTLEALAKKESAKALIKSDPVLVATVLMQVNPGALDAETTKLFQQYVHNA